MNVYITSAIQTLQDRLNAHLSLLTYRFSNLCVKAELGSLLPVTVTAENEYNLEDVAQVCITEDNPYQMLIYPNHNDYQKPLIEGIFDVHPEFRLEIVKDEDNEPNDFHLVYTMPKVDDDRRKLLNDTAKVFHTECNVDIEKECATYLTQLPVLSDRLSAEDFAETEMVLKHTREEYLEQSEKLYEQKLQEIEEAYQYYLSGEADNTAPSDQIDYTKGMRLDQGDE